MLNYIIAQAEKTEVPIPQPLQDAVHQLTMWIIIAAIAIPIILLLLLFIKSKIEQLIEKIQNWK